MATVEEQWSAGGSVRRRTRSGIHLHVDRQLPFVCLYRRPPDRSDPGTRRLVIGESAFVTAPYDPESRQVMERLLLSLAKLAAERFGAFLLIEVWSSRSREEPSDGPDLVPEPHFVVHARRDRSLSPVVGALEQALKKVCVHDRQATVDVVRRQRWSPSGMVAPLSLARLGRRGGIALGIEVNPIYCTASGELFPVLLRNLKRQFSVAVKRAVHHFAVTQTTVPPPLSYRALGQRLFARSVTRVDERLSDLDRSHDFLLEVTPVNLELAWRRFRRDRFDREPEFLYRPLPMDPVVAKRRLFSIPVDRIEEPTLAQLFREKQLHLDRQLTLLLDRGTPRFLFGSMQMYGRVERELLTLARRVLEGVPLPRRGRRAGRSLDAEGFAALAREEIAHYREHDASFTTQVQIRDDIYSGLMVSRGNLLIGHKARVSARQAVALVHHEIGTHALTYHNGRSHPFRQLADGLPGYDELQEGLAVFSEYLAGGLTPSRLGLLAARVIAAHLVEEGASFIDTFRVLHQQFGATQRTAFTVCARVHRGGGLTKDAVYLRGLVQVLDLVKGGSPLDALFCGKVAVHHLPLVDELRLRGVMGPSPFRPRVLDLPETKQRIQRLRQGATVLELCERRR